MPARTTVPRGRHAPPLEVRRSAQRERLFRAAAAVFAQRGFVDATAGEIAATASMSKATFYEHFDNKEDCVLALFDRAATVVLESMAQAARDAGPDPRERLRAGTRAFLDMVASNPAEAQTLLVEVMAAGERGSRRRDAVVAAFAAALDAENAAAARAHALPRFGSPHDSFALAGAVAELASRQVRLREPADVRDLEPVIERLLLGVLAAAPQA